MWYNNNRKRERKLLKTRKVKIMTTITTRLPATILNNYEIFPKLYSGLEEIRLCEKILNALETLGKQATVTEIQDIINADYCYYEGYSNQKISAELKKLVAVGMAKKSMVHTGEMITVKTHNGNKQVEKVISLFSLAE